MEQFFRVPNKVFSLPISHNELLIMVYILRCSSSGDAFPSHDNIAKACRISRSTVIRNIRRLEGKYLVITRLHNDVNHYKIINLD